MRTFVPTPQRKTEFCNWLERETNPKSLQTGDMGIGARSLQFSPLAATTHLLVINNALIDYLLEIGRRLVAKMDWPTLIGNSHSSI